MRISVPEGVAVAAAAAAERTDKAVLAVAPSLYQVAVGSFAVPGALH
jgi:hypothetical protein